MFFLTYPAGRNTYSMIAISKTQFRRMMAMITKSIRTVEIISQKQLTQAKLNRLKYGASEKTLCLTNIKKSLLKLMSLIINKLH